MLRRLTADDPRFKSLLFTPGLNPVVSDTTPESQRTDSRNGAGKSSLVELVHFLLGARVTNGGSHVAAHRALRGITFELVLDWTGAHDGLRVRRRAWVARFGSTSGTGLLRPSCSDCRPITPE